jgi:hypothetical protein
MLKVDLDQQHRNYVDYISPFVIDVLNEERPEIVSDASVADKLLSRFGLRIPTKAVQHVLRRLQRKGYLIPEDGVFVVAASLPNSDISNTRGQAQQHIDGVISALIQEASSHDLSWTTDDAIKAVTSFLSKFTVDCLRTYVFNTALPTIPEKKSVELYVVGRFIAGAQARKEPAFESFIVLVKGLMYRLYFVRRGRVIFILLNCGNAASQERDIRRTVKLASEIGDDL